MDIAWKWRRLVHSVRRLRGSIAIRGWRGTLKRAIRGRGINKADSIAQVGPVHVRLPPGPELHRSILIIETMTPDAKRDSGSARLWSIFRLLHLDGWRIDFFADDNDATDRDVVRLADIGVSVHRGHALTWLRQHGHRLDAIMLSRLPIADQYLAEARRAAPGARILFDTVDLHFIREERAASLNHNAALARQASRSRRRELAMVSQADVTFVVSSVEQSILAAAVPHARVELLSNIHEVTLGNVPFAGRSGLLFVGGFGHPPNADGVRWFVANVLPAVRAKDPSIILHVAGDIDDASRKDISRSGVIVHGRVDDLLPLMERSRISIAPLRFGAGVKGKVNQAMSYGLPVVLTSVAAEGMYLSDGVDALIEDDAVAMASAVHRLYHDEALWYRLSQGGRENISRHFSTNVARSVLRQALDGSSR